MAQFELSISSVANREGIAGALFEAWPDAGVEGRGGAGVKSAGPLPDWVTLTSMALTITASGYPTAQGIAALVHVVRSVRRNYPKAPAAQLRLTDGKSGDVLDLENVSEEVVKQTITRWLEQHHP